MSARRGGVYIGLGANLGDPARQLIRALGQLQLDGAVRVLRCSACYRTAPWGRLDQPEFANAVVEVDTTLEPAALVEALLATERALGRERDGERWGPRLIDLDLLLYRERELAQPGCRVPHPRLVERAFVLVPLAELAPDALVPGHGSVTQCLQRLPAAELASARRAADARLEAAMPPGQ
ncbi:MAG: 2-amino-4-hydroxy-6-hydroxymethyldihydropteridine diphosphokinase [Xanthomonadales bacterium]|nr:2-amino-4-hydroxy-6-hydroxymethyldihydropteridine diphosphokinase [Xanthomonadales bacterium]MBP7417064.1 2-amino-4-hydroxy-6-hydroxymethyldihydropteridine diphosphokinase [Xanthomonadales bacterium]